MAFHNNETLWLEFLQAWPIERLRTMTLAEYATVGSKDCFIHWIESRLDKYGSIWGGSAFKFGIYSRSSTSEKANVAGLSYDGNYGWYSKFGKTAGEAFERVRAEVVRVAEAARDGRLEAIDSVQLGDVYKWKIAFHYQGRQSLLIACVFMRRPLLSALGLPQSDRRVPLSKLYRDSASLRDPGESILAFSYRVWKDWTMNNPYEVKLSVAAVRDGHLPVATAAAPFADSMHGGSAGAEVAETARFRTDTGMAFESDVRVTSAGKGHVRRSMQEYFAEIGAKPGDSIFVTPQLDGEYLISRKVSALKRDVSDLPPVPPAPRSRDEVVRSNAPLNQILFGPPGTGKTYHAIDKALEILDPSFLTEYGTDRRALKERFDALLREGLIQFVTFHQSFSYEDFVEGLRAETDEDDGTLRYEIVDGVFKRLCDAARTRVVQEEPVRLNLTGRRIWKLSLGDSTTERHIYQECIEKNIALVGFGASVDFSGVKNREDIRRKLSEAGEEHTSTDFPVTAINTFVLQMKKGDLIVVTDGNLKFRALGEVTGDYRVVPREGDTYVQCRDVRWLRVYSPSLPYDQLMDNRFSQMTIYELREGSIDLAKLDTLLQAHGETVGHGKPRVLIIDEINRGNVSRILGELITLIEPSKRAGADEGLEAVLPYSKQRFTVPDNVHLIGTMNTADRSLAGLDIALRRRFQFVEMPPRPDLLADVTVSGINIGEMLAIMNQRIEVLLDRDHQLGHAYFMSLRNGDPLARLAIIFRHQILPLLQEYFFEDWQRIAWVLNDHRKPAGQRFVVPPSFSVDALFGPGAAVPAEAKLWRIDDAAFQRAESYQGILSAGPG